MAVKRQILACMFGLCSFAGFAWNGSGHMTCGAIAYYYLKANNPAALLKVIAALKLHPWYATSWAEKMSGMTEEERNVALFMLASTYADEARSIPDLGGGERTKWHYVDYPYVLDSNTHYEAARSPNAEGKITEFMSTLQAQEEGVHKAVDLAWLFHLIEDIHQPLHTVSMFDGQHPRGDKGGNDTYIQFDSSNAPVKLHSYWDRLISGSIRTIPSRAEKYFNEGLLQETEKEDTQPHQWIKESYEHAMREVYMDGEITGTKIYPTFVGKQYAKTSKELAEHLVYLAGIRLAIALEVIY